VGRTSHFHSTTTQTSSEKRLDFEKLLADLSARFVALPPEQVDGEIRKALHEVLGFFRIDRCSLLRLLPGKAMWLITHNADIEGVSPYPIETPMPVFHCNFANIAHYRIAAKDALNPCRHIIVFDFKHDGGGHGRGGTGTLSVDGRQVAQGRIEKTIP
jgi:hypothetical protein